MADYFAPQISDFDTEEAYHEALDAYYAAALNMAEWADVAGGDEFNAWADSLAA